MIQREAYIIKSSDDGKKHFCIDRTTEDEIMEFLKEDTARLKKFMLVRDIILGGLRNPELYNKEEISDKAKNVTAIKMFKHGQNIRIYCKEQSGENGDYYIVVSELLRKKKEDKVKGKLKTLIETVGNYEYKIVKRPEK